jgi:hypothetical protein
MAGADRSSDRPVKAYCFWLYLPSLEFYRVTRQADWLELLDSRHTPAGSYDVYICSRSFPLAEQGWPADRLAEMTVVSCETSDVIVALARGK